MHHQMSHGVPLLCTEMYQVFQGHLCLGPLQATLIVILFIFILQRTTPVRIILTGHHHDTGRQCTVFVGRTATSLQPSVDCEASRIICIQIIWRTVRHYFCSSPVACRTGRASSTPYCLHPDWHRRRRQNHPLRAPDISSLHSPVCWETDHVSALLHDGHTSACAK